MTETIEGQASIGGEPLEFGYVYLIDQVTRDVVDFDILEGSSQYQFSGVETGRNLIVVPWAFSDSEDQFFVDRPVADVVQTGYSIPPESVTEDDLDGEWFLQPEGESSPTKTEETYSISETTVDIVELFFEDVAAQRGSTTDQSGISVETEIYLAPENIGSDVFSEGTLVETYVFERESDFLESHTVDIELFNPGYADNLTLGMRAIDWDNVSASNDDAYFEFRSESKLTQTRLTPE